VPPSKRPYWSPILTITCDFRCAFERDLNVAGCRTVHSLDREHLRLLIVRHWLKAC